MEVKREGTRDQLADRINLVVRDRNRLPIDPQDLDHADGRLDRQALLIWKEGKAIARKQGKTHGFSPIFAAGNELLVDQLVMSRAGPDGVPVRVIHIVVGHGFCSATTANLQTKSSQSGDEAFPPSYEGSRNGETETTYDRVSGAGQGRAPTDGYRRLQASARFRSGVE